MMRRTVLWLFLMILPAGGLSFSGMRPEGAPPAGTVCYRYCAEPQYAATPEHDKVKVFVTNDVHGYVFEDENRGRIGYARLRGRMDAARNAGYAVVLMDAGDAFSGNAVAQFDSGRSVAELMGEMGYRVLTPGNHAFDYNFMAEGGDGYPLNIDNQRRDLGDTVTTLVEYFRRIGLPDWTGETVADNLIVHADRAGAEQAFQER